jgi:hypothetical protein
MLMFAIAHPTLSATDSAIAFLVVGDHPVHNLPTNLEMAKLGVRSRWLRTARTNGAKSSCVVFGCSVRGELDDKLAAN